MNSILVGYTRHDHKYASCNRERAAAEERASGSHDVEALMSVDKIVQKDLFWDDQTQDLLQVRDAKNAQEDVSEAWLQYMWARPTGGRGYKAWRTIWEPGNKSGGLNYI